MQGIGREKSRVNNPIYFSLDFGFRYISRFLDIWKARMSSLLDKYGLKEYLENFIVVTTDPHQLETYKNENSKSKRTILNVVKEHMSFIS